MKRRILTFLVVALALGVATANASAQDLAGRWVLDVALDAGNGQATFIFRVEGSSISGTYEGVLGSEQITGTIEGDRVRFGFESPDAGAITFSGTVEGTRMEGTCEYGLLGAGTFIGNKAS